MNRIFQKKRAVPAFVALMAVLLIVSCGMFIDGYKRCYRQPCVRHACAKRLEFCRQCGGDI